MLCYKAAQVIVVTKNDPKDWKMEDGRSGVSHTGIVAVLGEDMKVQNLKIKGKTAEELNEKIAALTLGKPFHFSVTNIESVFKNGDDGKRQVGYEFVVDIPKALRKAA